MRRKVDQSFGRLPENVLGTIAASLPFQDRLAFFSCCPATRAFHKAQRTRPASAATTVLWPELTFSVRDIEEAEQLAVWLALNRHQLGCLELECRPRRYYCSGKATEEELKAQLPQLNLLLLGLMSGGTVHSLVLESEFEVRLGSWLRALPQLQSLSIEAARLTLGASLSQLQGLTRLSMSCMDASKMYPSDREQHFISLPNDALPPTLQTLCLQHFVGSTLPLHTMPVLPALRSLELHCPKDGNLQLGWLSAYTQLTTLHLSGCTMPEIPVQLTMLTALEELELESAGLQGEENVLAPLSALQKLTTLSLADNRLKGLPAAVLSLPALQDLNIEKNDMKASLPLSSSVMTRLLLDENTVKASAEQLTGLVALHTLEIAENEDAWRFTTEDAAKILKSLRALPHFKLLDAESLYGEPHPLYIAREVLDALELHPFIILACDEANDDW